MSILKSFYVWLNSTANIMNPKQRKPLFIHKDQQLTTNEVNEFISTCLSIVYHF